MIKYFDDPVVFTGLREPVDRLHSEVAYQQRLRNMQGATPLDINEFLKTIDNPACRFLLQRFPQLSGDNSRTLFERASRPYWIHFTISILQMGSIRFPRNFYRCSAPTT